MISVSFFTFCCKVWYISVWNCSLALCVHCIVQCIVQVNSQLCTVHGWHCFRSIKRICGVICLWGNVLLTQFAVYVTRLLCWTLNSLGLCPSGCHVCCSSFPLHFPLSSHFTSSFTLLTLQTY